MKKNIFLLLFTLFSFSAIHAEIEWTLSDYGTLSIFGSGNMPNYNSSARAPWYNDREKIMDVSFVFVTSIGDYAFMECPVLTSVTIPNSVTSIGKSAFVRSGLTSITIPNSVTSIGESAFAYCTCLTSITIPNSVTSIGNDAFMECSDLTSVTIPNSVKSIGSHTFYHCSSLTSITIPNSVTSIGTYAFERCSGLTSITIPNSVTSIGTYAFNGCSGLTSITIPNSVTSIRYHAFDGCSGLTSITFERTTPPEIEYAVFDGVNKSIPIYVPANSIEAYKSALGGLGLSNIKANPKQLFLTDDEAYTRESDSEGVDVSYTRNFTNVNWQAIYLPFALRCDELKNDFEIAFVNGVSQTDKDDDGVIDETVIEIIKMKEGTTSPNAPYLIRAKTTGEKTFSAKSTTVEAAKVNSVDCSTTMAKFTITGTYNEIPSETMIANDYYGMGGGKLIKSDGSNGLKPFRWYMKVESRDYSKYDVNNAAKVISIKVLDEETTGIAELQTANINSSVYDINGRKVNEKALKPGIYVKNGKKFVVK